MALLANFNDKTTNKISNFKFYNTHTSTPLYYELENTLDRSIFVPLFLNYRGSGSSPSGNVSLPVIRPLVGFSNPFARGCSFFVSRPMIANEKSQNSGMRNYRCDIRVTRVSRGMLDSRFRGVSTENWRERRVKDRDGRFRLCHITDTAPRENAKRVFGKRFDRETSII